MVNTTNYSDSEIVCRGDQYWKTIYYINDKPFPDSSYYIYFLNSEWTREYYTYNTNGKLIHTLRVLSNPDTVNIDYTYSGNNIESQTYSYSNSTYSTSIYIYDFNHLEMVRGFYPTNLKSKNIKSGIHFNSSFGSGTRMYNNQFDSLGRLIRFVDYINNDSTVVTFTYY